MTNSNLWKNLLWVILAVSVVLGIMWQWFPLSDAKARIESLPLKGPDYVGESIPLTDMEKTFFKNVNSIKRNYTIVDKNYFVYALDGTHNRNAIHDPTYCLAGSGWRITKEEKYPLKNGYGTVFTLEKGPYKKVVLLWFSTGKKQFSSPLMYWIMATLRRLTLGYSSDEPVLIYAQPLDKGNEDWEFLLKKFPELMQI